MSANMMIGIKKICRIRRKAKKALTNWKKGAKIFYVVKRSTQMEA